MIIGNLGCPELGEELTSGSSRTDPEIAKRFARTTFRSESCGNPGDLAAHAAVVGWRHRIPICERMRPRDSCLAAGWFWTPPVPSAFQHVATFAATRPIRLPTAMTGDWIPSAGSSAASRRQRPCAGIENAQYMAVHCAERVATWSRAVSRWHGGRSTLAAWSPAWPSCCSARWARTSLSKIVVGAGLCLTNVDVGELENASTDLVINARDAMPKSGILTIESSNACLNDGVWRPHR